MGDASREIFRSREIAPKIKMILRNSLIRGAMIYGLDAKGLPRNQLNRTVAYMYIHQRTMAQPKWKQEDWYPAENMIYRTLLQ